MTINKRAAFRRQRMGASRAIAIVLAMMAAGCGGDSPSAPTPTPTVEPGNPVRVVVFYDEDGNRQLDGNERARLPHVSVEVSGRRGETEVLTGHGVVNGVPAGQHTVSIDAATLPPFYVAGPVRSVTVPTSAEVELAATLRIGNNRPNVYMAFGDSITAGDGSSDGNGYPTLLEQRLRGYFGRGSVINRGATATRSTEGVGRIQRNLGLTNPAYTLILYGTNDWNQSACNSDITTCFTQASFRSMIQQTKANGSLPIVSTIIPCNTGFNANAPPDRNERIQQMNAQIRSLAQTEGVPVAESYNAFITAAAGNLRSLFVDHIHPNDTGHDLIAQSFYEAITRATGGNAASFGEPPEIAFAPSRFKKAGSEGRIPFAPIFPETSIGARPLDIRPLDRD